MGIRSLLTPAARFAAASVLVAYALSGPKTAIAQHARAVTRPPVRAVPSESTTPWAETVLDAFGALTDGRYPFGSLIADANGALYGTTYMGGNSNRGTVFKVTPHGPAGRTESVLHAFTGGLGDGANPTAALLVDASGALYGTTYKGGGSANCAYGLGCGTVFRLTPPPLGQTAWTETVLHAFTGANGDGSGPNSTLIADRRGALYGTTSYGGGCRAWAPGCGTVFKLTPPQGGLTGWTQSVLHAFSGINGDGEFPIAGVIADASGALYGTTDGGGTGQEGTVFKLAPPSLGTTAWTSSVLYSFIQGTITTSPGAGIVIFRGSLYGVANGGAFKLTPPQAGRSRWTESLLYSFSYDTIGGGFGSSLIVDRSGNLYGTSYEGGVANDGTAFVLMPPGRGETAWTGRALHSFSGAKGDGAFPEGGLFADQSGDLYGTTSSGGTTTSGFSQSCYVDGNPARGCGTVYKLQNPYRYFSK